MRKIPESTVRRLALYLHLLEESETAGRTTINSGELARRGGTTAAQVRKDLSFFGSFGKRGLGYAVTELAKEIRGILGLDRPHRVVVVGAGRIGSALAQYEGLGRRGFEVVALFDRDPNKVGTKWDGLVVRDVEQLEIEVRGKAVDIGVVVTPAGAAQEVADRLVAAGVSAILNFAPVRVLVPSHVEIKHVNLAVELETLSYALAHR
jgi:redox-sensing transcriptional repressor